MVSIWLLLIINILTKVQKLEMPTIFKLVNFLPDHSCMLITLLPPSVLISVSDDVAELLWSVDSKQKVSRMLVILSYIYALHMYFYIN